MLFGKGSYGIVYINNDKSISKHINIISENKLIDSNIKELCFYSIVSSLHTGITNKTLQQFTKIKEHVKHCKWLKLTNHQGIINMNYLGSVITLENIWSISQIEDFVAQFINIIKCFQACNISHGDIKPNNICYNSNNNTWNIIDFGSVCFHTKNKSEYTKVRCTLFYIAPDELLDSVYKKDADLWSFGVVIFEMYTRK